MSFTKRIPSILAIGMLMSILISMASTSTSGQGIAGYSGTISTEKIEQGDTVHFTGTVYNHDAQIIYVHSFNITFEEKLGGDARRTAKKLNITHQFEGQRRLLQPNDSYTWTLDAKIDFPPATYNVSIYFGTSGSVSTDSSEWDERYALTNVEFVILGSSRNIKIISYVAYTLLGITVVLILLYIYNRKFK